MMQPLLHVTLTHKRTCKPERKKSLVDTNFIAFPNFLACCGFLSTVVALCFPFRSDDRGVPAATIASEG